VTAEMLFRAFAKNRARVLTVAGFWSKDDTVAVSKALLTKEYALLPLALRDLLEEIAECLP
jgi:hypothetical protein